MANPIVRFFDIATNETIDREMTDAEYEAYLESAAALKAKEDALLA